MTQTVKISSLEYSSSEKAQKLWSCLDSVANHYKNVDMSKISKVSEFDSDEWDVIGDNKYNFRWNQWLKNESFYPLMILCKITAYYNIQSKNKSISTVQTEIIGFINSFIPILQSKSILMADRNQPFNLLSTLSTNDILLIAQTSLANNQSLSIQPFNGLHQIHLLPSDVFPNAEFLNSGILTPWQEQNLSAVSWVKGLKKAYGIDTTIKPYPPLKFETVSEIVKKAVPFINEHFETIESVFNYIEDFHQTNKAYDTHKINLEVGEFIESNYGEKLNKILPFTKYEKNNHYRGKITHSWYSKLEQLTQGAAAWIILLTTGLRNVDMRNLENNCCQPSKRNDLLHYLITDIKKTHLSNYVIPVPEQTVKAVKLASIAKINRSGAFLFAKNNTRSSDNTSNDKRKMNGGETFNNLIKNFANHYNITLNTTLTDEQEATAHCIRTTLAGYIGANSVAAILILKKLFGHSNALMPDAYLSHNPLVIAERHKNIANAQNTLADDMANGMISKKLSGTKGKQMLVGAEYIRRELDNELKNESLTQMQMQINLKDRIKEMLLTRIQENQIYALKTPMSVVCMRNCSDSSDTPCAKLGNHEKRKKNGVSKEITDALSTLPNPAQCVGKECSDALFGEAWSRDLLGTFDYYIQYLKAVGHHSIDIKNEAEIFVKNYGSILKDIYSDEREVGYFD